MMGFGCIGAKGSQRVRFGILGTVRALDVDTLSPKDRTVLATLLVRAGSVVPVGILAQALWDDEPPPSARNTIQGHVKQLRKLLGADRIITRNPGYLIDIRPGELDLHEFTSLRDQAAAAAASDRWDRAAGLLADALALWEGDPLSDAPSSYLRRTEIPRLTELRDEALEARIDADLHLGRHEAVTGELRALVAEHPYRERLWEQLMLALSRSGRRSEALEAYGEARAKLTTDLGIDPGPRLAELHRQILAADPAIEGSRQTAVPDVPRQLPADLPDFTGRNDELHHLIDAVATRSVVVISGPGGIGKTALAVRVAHEVAERYPDGQLFVVMGEMTPGDALGKVLRGLGLSDAKLPADTDERAALYRTVTAGRRLLVVLDDVRGSAQVRALVPGTGGCAVLVTSRALLSDLAGATFATLPVLPETESVQLMRAIIGERRADGDPDGTKAVIAACAGLPLAIRIAAARLAVRPAWTPAQLGELLASEQQRLGELATGDTAVRTTFEVSYRGLSRPEAARLFRMFGLAGLPTISLPALSALAGVGPYETSSAAETLLGAHLLASPEPGRYQAHDLLRLYAAERAATEEAAADREAALRRLLSWYLHSLHASVALLATMRHLPEPPPAPPGVPESAIGDLPAAIGWLRAERANIIAAVALAASVGMNDLCCLLARITRGFLEWSGGWADQVTVSKTGLAAAWAIGDPAAAAELLNNLGSAHRKLGRFEAATASYTEALAIRRSLGDMHGEAAVLSNLGVAEIDAGLVDSAIKRFTRALAIARSLGNTTGEGVYLRNMGSAHAAAGRWEEALSYFRQAAPLHRTDWDRATTAQGMGAALIGWGQTGEGMAVLWENLGLCQRNRLRYEEAKTLASLGDGHLALGDTAAAADAWRQAHSILSEVGASEAADVLKRLSSVAGN
jgi:DNA-binding SARP family transcriptional activator